MLELGSRQNMTDMDTKWARGICIANALVCQLCWTFLFYFRYVDPFRRYLRSKSKVVRNRVECWRIFCPSKFFGAGLPKTVQSLSRPTEKSFV